MKFKRMTNMRFGSPPTTTSLVMSALASVSFLDAQTVTLSPLGPNQTQVTLRR